MARLRHAIVRVRVKVGPPIVRGDLPARGRRGLEHALCFDASTGAQLGNRALRDAQAKAERRL